MGSSRLPGKVLLEAAGHSYLEHMIARVRRAALVEEVVVATVATPDCDAIEAAALRSGAFVFRGSEDDVLDRVVGAALSRQADIVVQLTGDCPLMDPALVDECVAIYLAEDHDYVANELQRTYSIGFDVAVMSVGLLALIQRQPDLSPGDREHVTTYIVDRPNRFRLRNVSAPPELDAAHLGLTLDTAEDHRLLRSIFEALYPSKPQFGARDVIELMAQRPDLLQLNQHVVRKAKLGPNAS